MASIADINEHLQKTKNGQDTAGTENQLNEIKKAYKAAFGSTLGDADGQIIDEIFKCLVQTKNSAAEQGNTTTKAVLTTIVKSLTGIEDKMEPTISAADIAKINKIFGSELVTISVAPETVSTANATNMNHKLFCDGSPTNISAIIKKASGATDAEFETTMKKLLDEDLQEVMAHAIEIIQSDEVSTKMTNALNEVKKKFKKLNSGLDSGNFLKDLSENFSSAFGTKIGAFGDEFTSGNVLDILNASFGKLNPIDLASSFTTIPLSILNRAGILGIATNITSSFDMNTLISKMQLQAPELQAELDALKTKLDTQIATLKESKTTVAATVNDGNTAKHLVRNSETTVKEEQFTLLGSQQEIESILKSAERDITTVVWHWTGHYANDGHIGAPEINQEFSTNAEAIPYHFIIRKDGSIQTGAPFNVTTDHVRDEFKKLSFGVAFVGGYNGAKGGPPGLVRLDVASITQAQWKSFDIFMKAFYIIFPGGDAFGNNDLSIDDEIPPVNIGPGFDVPAKILAAPFYRLNSGFPMEDRKFLTVDDIIAKDKASKDRQLEQQDIQ
tara:strand:- start:174 stop:1847 length:1674 start_codon:yes stop_codon:yes gene_type:complete